jgi:NAD(P)-dependent dehydrogenase (short-subunit alcohol dehydrogenase family)
MPISPPLNFTTDLTGRVGLVTGASSGLGWRFGKVLAAAGAKVAVTGRRLERVQALAEEIRGEGGAAMPLVLDVSRTGELAAAVDAVEAELGRIDILVNNAGMPDANWATRLSPEKTDQVFDTNLRGPWVLSCEVARRLIAARRPGWMVNITSMGAHVSTGKAASALYSVTKAGMTRMTEVLAMEWAQYNINVNAIAPGTFSSEMIDGMVERVGDGFMQSFPRKRIGRADQLDSTLLYLVSPSSDFITGTIIKADDGQMSR